MKINHRPYRMLQCFMQRQFRDALANRKTLRHMVRTQKLLVLLSVAIISTKILV